MSLQSKYASVVARELRHHAVWEPGEPIRLGDYGTFSRGRFSVHGNIRDDYGIEFDVARSRNREFAFRSDGVSESRSETKAKQPGAVAELRVGFRNADALYVSSPSAWTEQIKSLARAVRPLIGNPQWRPEWMVVTRLYHASQAIILLSNSDDADVCLNLGADGVALSGDASNDVGEQGSVALQLTGVRGPLFMGLHRVHKDLEDVVPRRRLVNRVLVLAGAGLVASGALTSWLVVSSLQRPKGGEHVATVNPTSAGDTADPDKGDERKVNPAKASKGSTEGLGQDDPDESHGHGGVESAGSGAQAPKSVGVRFESNAPAEIRDRHGAMLGKTSDGAIELPKGEPLVVALLADGFQGRSFEIVPRADGLVRVELEKERTSTAKSKVGAGGGHRVTRCSEDDDCRGAAICVASRCVDAPTPAELVIDTTGAEESGGVAEETASGSTADDSADSTGDVVAAPAEGPDDRGDAGDESAGRDGDESPAEGPAPALLWLTLGLSIVGLGLVIAWLRRRFFAPLEPVRPGDVDEP
jgi:hypothetical protein